jgi:hypothetical protein
MRAELSLVMMMFDGLISRCTMFRACAAASPAAIWQTQSIACRKARGRPVAYAQWDLYEVVMELV